MSGRCKKSKCKSKKSKVNYSDKPIVVRVVIKNERNGSNRSDKKESLMLFILNLSLTVFFISTGLFRSVIENWDVIEPLDFIFKLIFRFLRL